MSLRDWLLPAATGIAGLVAGLLIGGGETEQRSVASPSTAVFPGTRETATSAPPTSVTLEDLRRVVREELAAHLPEAQGQPAPQPRFENSTATSEAEQQAAATQARAMLDAALARRSWTEEDRHAILPHVMAMSPAQREEWLLQYVQAVNQGRLVPDSERPPF